MTSSRRARRSGMTLIEIMVAMLILSLGATSLIALFASASSTHKRAVDRTHAGLVAEEIFSEVQARYFADESLADIASDLENDLPETIDGYFWELKLHRPGEGGARGRALTLEEAEATWSEEELVARLRVKSSSALDAHEEVYVTILLPRPRW